MDPKKQKLVAGLLVAAALLIWIRGFLIRPARSKLPAGAQTKTVSDTEKLVSDTSPPRTSRFTEWGGNPFEIKRRIAAAPGPAAVPSADSPSGYSVNGILWDAQAPSAILNGRLVGLGDELSGGWKVIEIQKDKVVLSDGLTTQTLTVD